MAISLIKFYDAQLLFKKATAQLQVPMRHLAETKLQEPEMSDERIRSR